ncbi:hypothetical protein SERLA73DRAFT_187114 [Serpula lacrymans var. lacrymans S7.3]|uniref:Monooxygenase n=2 Tax=Serpula lacrymans var. lacrymans TaxID=341189 RepID=F8Q8I1_SERL3|nr:putative monooxygenase [Serpula lacrymans var. lacrymans S7.9]EGN95869.1 hypothetical protein SERLA73DRAFT_187114 [Serpula lacrymans var. lacrymans S7.3]EGO21384.1 putative monooxygenase [Serpula lacrymans var. lacrymans S7.9]
MSFLNSSSLTSSITLPTSVQNNWAAVGLAFLSAGAVFGVSRTFISSSRSTYIINSSGERLPHADEDTRFSRFSHGKELGDRLVKELGPIYTFQSGTLRELVLTQPEDIKVYYRDALGKDESKAHIKSLAISFGDYMRRFLSQSVGFKFGNDWKRIRDAVDPHFIRKMALDAVPNMKIDYDSWMKALRGNAAAVAKGSSPNDPFEIEAVAATKELPFKAIAKSIYGETLNDKWYERLWELHMIHERVMANAIGNKNATKAWYRFFPTQANKDLRAFKNGYKAFNFEIVAESEKLGYDTVAVRMYGSVADGLISEDEFNQTLDEILFANIDVTSVAQAWFLLDIGKYPDIQERLRAEVASVDEYDPKAVADYLSSTTNLMHLVHSESARLHPILWYNIPEVISVEKNIGGYHIPRGTSVCISTYHVNTNPAIWGSDSTSFRPERFKEISSSQYRHAFWRYGLGPRQCLGKNFAPLIVKLVALKVLKTHRIETVTDVDFDRMQFTVTPKAALRFTPLRMSFLS